MGTFADLLCKFGRTVSLLPVLTRNYLKKLPETSFCGEIFGHVLFSRSVLPLKRGDFQVSKGGLGFVEGQNDEEAAGEQTRVRGEKSACGTRGADEGRQVNIDG